MATDGIGYNQSQVVEVVENMKGALNSLKTAMQDNWPTMVSTFRTNWVGEDEAGFEKTFSDEIKKMYQNCDLVSITAIRFIVDAANNWAEWQSNVSTQFGGATVTQLEVEIPQEDTLDITVEEQTFGQDVDRGLTDAGAEQNLIAAIDDYVNNVKTSFDNVYGEIQTSAAFIGSEQAGAMDEFVHGLSESMKQVLTMVDSFKTETIPDLVKAYASQQTQVATDAGTASSTINDSVSGIGNAQ